MIEDQKLAAVSPVHIARSSIGRKATAAKKALDNFENLNNEYILNT